MKMKLKIDKAIDSYKDGKNTIRECAEIAGLRYFELLMKHNLIVTSPENIEFHLNKFNGKN